MGARLPVKVLYHRDRLLITQLQSNNVLQMIREPVEVPRICYVNLPANSTNQLIIQYVSQRRGKQMLHLQGASVSDCCNKIRSRLPYVGNWTLSCKEITTNTPNLIPIDSHAKN
ncbi:hypothetical protein Ciccas_013870 [Cichlidogyrus casuarinus]|uniref:Uncharacterized protein n=1 Tax=Cichlidogyrus casuarinus TaxID=1844966 RepID=A0ABD2PJG2_9PLAT